MAPSTDVTAASAKQLGTPALGMSTPAASAPPATASRAASAFSAIAFGASSRLTASATRTWRAGMSNTFNVPTANENDRHLPDLDAAAGCHRAMAAMTGAASSPR